MKEYIMQELRNGLPTSLMQYVDEIELLVMHDKYREAYLKMYEIIPYCLQQVNIYS